MNSGWREPKMWATPSAADSVGTTGGGQNKSLRDDVKMWPTPQAADHKNMDTAGQRMLSSEVKMWPTPTARDYKDNGHSPAELARNSVTLATHAGGSLNPAWVEWLMGYPVGYTDLNN
jgi:hypothetical protein